MSAPPDRSLLDVRGDRTPDARAARPVPGVGRDDWADARSRLLIAQARYHALGEATAEPATVADAIDALLAARARVEDLRRALSGSPAALD